MSDMRGGGAAAADVLGMAAAVVRAGAEAASDWADAARVVALAVALEERAAGLAADNAAAFGAARAALHPEDGGAMPENLEDLLDAAAEVPLEIAWAAVDLCELAVAVVRHGRPRDGPDQLVALILAGAVAEASAVLVRANLTVTDGDERQVAADGYVRRAAELRATAEGLIV